jgi:hypothetical protein
MIHQHDHNDDDDDDDDVSMTSNNNYSTTVFEEPYRYPDEDCRSASQQPRQQHVSHSSPISPRHVLRACKVRGWTIQPDALQAMLDTIQSTVVDGDGGDGGSENHHQNINHRVSTTGKSSIGIPSIINNYLDQLQPYMVTTTTTTTRSEDGGDTHPDDDDDDDDTTHHQYRNNRRTKNPTMITRMIWNQMIRECHGTTTTTTTETVPLTSSANMTHRRRHQSSSHRATTTTAPSRALLDIQASTNTVSRHMNSSSTSSSRRMMMMMTPTTPTITTTHHFRIISAFDTPQLIYDMTRKQFHVQSMPSSSSSSSSSLPLLLGSAEDKV